MQKSHNLSGSQVFMLVLLRLVIGWHFLYEGITKLLNANWTSVGYILDSKGFLAEFFYSLANNPKTIEIIDIFNIWGLILIGAGLILGSFSRLATFFGIILLAFYYLSHPPFIGLKYAVPMEGSYLFVNKTLIELVGLLVLFVFPTSRIVGLDRLIFGGPKKQTLAE
jgi:thiosulfate dehydrogenase (quinone) large subunit